MPINSVRDNENSRSKRKEKINKNISKDRKEQEETEAILKGSQLNGFIVHLSQIFCS